ncbi:MAG: CsgG/HfaB family protein [Spirochaetota bacterium]
MKRSCAAFIIFTVLTALSFGQVLPIAVLELAANGVSPADAKAVTGLLQSEFAANKRYRVIERGNVESILKEQEFSQTGCTESSCAVKIGKMLSVRAMVFGSISKLGESFFIAVNIVDVESAAVISTSKAKVSKLDDADDAVREIVAALGEGRSKTTESGIRIDIALPDVGAIVSNAIASSTRPLASEKAASTAISASVRPLVAHPGYAVWPVNFSIVHPISITGFERRGTIVFFSVGVITTFTYRLYGLNACGIVSIMEEDLAGLSASGIGNVVKEYGWGMMAAGIFNAATDAGLLAQFATVNVCRNGGALFQAGAVNVSKNARGAQIGVVNVASGSLIGVQIGVVNVAGRLGGVQIGVVNVTGEGGLPFMPIGNIGFAF